MTRAKPHIDWPSRGLSCGTPVLCKQACTRDWGIGGTQHVMIQHTKPHPGSIQLDARQMACWQGCGNYRHQRVIPVDHSCWQGAATCTHDGWQDTDRTWKMRTPFPQDMVSVSCQHAILRWISVRVACWLHVFSMLIWLPCSSYHFEMNVLMSVPCADGNAGPNGEFPDGTKKPGDHLRKVFYRMGFSDQDIVALSGETHYEFWKYCQSTSRVQTTPES